MRWYQCFKTKKERTEWEREQGAKDERFRVCMRMTARQLENDLHMRKGDLSEGYKYATIYTTD